MRLLVRTSDRVCAGVVHLCAFVCICVHLCEPGVQCFACAVILWLVLRANEVHLVWCACVVLQGLLERAGGHMANVTPASATDSGKFGGGTRQGFGS